MTRAKALATALAAATVSLAPPLPASAQGVFVPPPSQQRAAPLTGARANIAQQLYQYGYGDVDVRRLTTSQVAQINYLLHAGRSGGDTRALIGAALARPGRLQSLITGNASVGVGVTRRN
ncbi:hypothetical protein JQC91_02895 [Jannaschia sp. Os4]|uniref:hypothetical protein n=1 Tax=Jannaschia sp. Os4 TaxID=2807617 RepID=UPI00193AB962|nr:hypothetical protein [Jannaschia sp. Os4]MBM2575242.1 hypothetical protein [Jannaschia sp. Os4]